MPAPGPAPYFDLFIPGRPAPGGSKTPGTTKAGKTFLRPASKYTAAWMRTVSKAARTHMEGRGPEDGAVELRMIFYLARPKRHFRTGRFSGELRADAPTPHTAGPDLTKLIRSTEDALKGIAWTDDCLVAEQHAAKRYGARPGVRITIRRLGAR